MITEKTFEDKLFDDKVPLTETINPEDWMTPKEVADLFGVRPRTVNRWLVVSPFFDYVRTYKTLGGHRRFYRPDVLKALETYDKQQNSN